MFKVKFRTGNAAFHDDYGDTAYDLYVMQRESARIIREIADKLEKGFDCGNCMDINGNKVGEWSLFSD